jgi:hypothetical protein
MGKSLGRFHLDDLGTEIGQDHGAQRARNIIGQIENLDPL